MKQGEFKTSIPNRQIDQTVADFCVFPWNFADVIIGMMVRNDVTMLLAFSELYVSDSILELRDHLVP